MSGSRAVKTVGKTVKLGNGRGVGNGRLRSIVMENDEKGSDVLF